MRERNRYTPEDVRGDTERANLNELLHMERSALMAGAVLSHAMGEMPLSRAREIVASVAEELI